MIKKAGILGFGLIGGSIALALKNRCNIDVVGFSRSEGPLRDAYAQGIISAYSVSDLTVFADCDIIFLCTPVNRICGYARQLIPIIKKGCILTDAGSTKGEIYKELSEINDICFIGAHPMAGSEKTGFSSAKDNLYENAFYILTPSAMAPQNLIDEYTELVRKIGAIPIVMDPYKHDHVVAAISHVPHIIAAGLVNTVSELDDEEHDMHTLAAGGFKDITRIASSGSEMWSSICAENRTEILNVIDVFTENIGKFRRALAAEDYERIHSLFSSAREFRNSFSEGIGRSHLKAYTFKVDISDQPGAIADVARILSDQRINIKNIGIINNRDYSDGVMQVRLESDSALKKASEILAQNGYNVII